MIRSMTGFGRGEETGDGRRFVVEIRSVNHRYSDIVTRLPKEYALLEDRVRRSIQAVIDRGRLDVYVGVQVLGGRKRFLQVDKELAMAYYRSLEELKGHLNIPGAVDVAAMTRLPDIFVLEEVTEDAEHYWPVLEAALKKALQRVIQMRTEEGRALAEDMMARVSTIQELLDQVEARAPEVVAEYRERLQKRIKELLGDNTLDQDRLALEVSLYAERSDITEELVRLRSHLRQMISSVTEGGAVGRKLQFILQEIHRELNTVGSKAGDMVISRKVVEAKTELERLREQVQNVE